MPDEPGAELERSRTLDGILTRLRQGDAADPELRRRLDAAFSKHHRALRSLIGRELRGFPPQQHEETLQDVLVVAWTKLPTHDGRSFRGWLFGIATRTCANVRRKRQPALFEDGLFDAGSDAESAYARLRREEREQLVGEVSRACLDPGDQEIAYMRFVLDLPREEVARLAGLADAEAVRVAMVRIQRRMSRGLAERLAALGHGSSLLRPDPE
jgi:RNA polymerase sigma factor (sigma-70 family)